MESINGSGMKRAALINDYSCFGKCSLTVSLPILSAYGVESVAVPTAILSTHTAGFDGYVVRDMSEDMEAFAAHWEKLGMKFDCIYTGFFADPAQIDFACRFIRTFSTPDTLIFVDPVLGDNGALYGCFNDSYVDAMRSLASLASWITPNRTEAALLAGCGMEASDEELLSRLPNKNVVLTSVSHDDKIGYLARLGDETVRIEKPIVDIRLHGAGDVFASALCAQLLCDASPADALREAADFCDESIRATASRLPAHWYGVAFEDILKKKLLG